MELKIPVLKTLKYMVYEGGKPLRAFNTLEEAKKCGKMMKKGMEDGISVSMKTGEPIYPNVIEANLEEELQYENIKIAQRSYK